ncbi:unnamed protein product [Hymenolepis diminuta]|uniref:Uncharacterized protein n=1 Tax=Hymenolepis diminuta TaxID=6216 RepID=A0A564YXI2_HYMDI|nr:unnamed protein product [Hymenolepis diminuta]
MDGTYCVYFVLCCIHLDAALETNFDGIFSTLNVGTIYELCIMGSIGHCSVVTDFKTCYHATLVHIGVWIIHIFALMKYFERKFHCEDSRRCVVHPISFYFHLQMFFCIIILCFLDCIGEKSQSDVKHDPHLLSGEIKP